MSVIPHSERWTHAQGLRMIFHPLRTMRMDLRKGACATLAHMGRAQGSGYWPFGADMTDQNFFWVKKVLYFYVWKYVKSLTQGRRDLKAAHGKQEISKNGLEHRSRALSAFFKSAQNVVIFGWEKNQNVKIPKKN